MDEFGIPSPIPGATIGRVFSSLQAVTELYNISAHPLMIFTYFSSSLTGLTILISADPPSPLFESGMLKSHVPGATIGMLFSPLRAVTELRDILACPLMITGCAFSLIYLILVLLN